MAKFQDYKLYRGIVTSLLIILSIFQAENVDVALTYMGSIGEDENDLIHSQHSDTALICWVPVVNNSYIEKN